MKDILEILKYTLPSLIVFLTVCYFLKKYFDNEDKKRNHESLLKNQDVITPLRLQAYERIILFLERISPESLIVRVNKPGYTSKELHTELISTIRIEWEHNLSQQLYISNKSWEVIKNARANVIQLINIAADKVKGDSKSITLSKEILSSLMTQEKIHTGDAIKFLKEEMNRIF
jgi:hypothetical protein